MYTISTLSGSRIRCESLADACSQAQQNSLPTAGHTRDGVMWYVDLGRTPLVAYCNGRRVRK